MNFLITLFILLITPISSARDFLEASDKMPLEFNLAIDFLQVHTPRDSSKELESKLHLIDHYYGQLSKKERFFIAKSELYKFLLKNPPTASATIHKLLKKINLKAKTTSNLEDGFVSWFYFALRSDLNSIYLTKEFNELVQIKRRNLSISTKHRKIIKRLNLVVPWIKILADKTNYEIINFIEKRLHKYLDTLIRHGKYFAILTSTKLKKQSSALTLFKIKTVKDLTENNSDAILSAIDEITKENAAKLPRPSNDWIPREDDFASFISKPLIIKKDNEYKVPGKLPVPTDDWILDL